MERTHKTRLSGLLATLLLISFIVTASGALAAPTHSSRADPQAATNNSDVNTSIQELINRALPNSTIVLPAGTYNEILTIQKPLHLKGQGATQTFISPTSPTNGYALRITAPGVIISNLDITNLGPGLYTTGVKISAASTTIQNCTFHDNPIGIAMWSPANIIVGCDFQGCDDEGVALLGTATTPCTNNTISSCTFSNNCDGIELQYAAHNLIEYCSFTQNTHAGIDAIGSSNNHNEISQCQFSANQGFGLYLAGSSDNLITQCSFSDDAITFAKASNNTLFKSQGTRIQLMEDSSLIIEQCSSINTSDIITEQSSFEIRSDKTDQLSVEKNTHPSSYHPLLLSLLSRYKSLTTLFEQLRHIRM